ncbi:hypothetical protein UFOVP601_7 [uncultured Caudovirales phage]|uniref:Uncharacterized protein n=1 Tax=uncultured Caudovirales phage TaxID=2100421 RepID=A0A6J5N6B2_9CAUD|nr:hypothetical protein UFOVP601_7 [uncultured Caudovirales phage]
MDEMAFYEDMLKRKRMLPQSLGMQSPAGVLTQDVQPGNALPQSMRARAAELRNRVSVMEGQEPDISAMQAYAKQQGESGNAAMLNALAAQFAGESFQPVQGQYLKRAMAAQEPMKLGSGMLTPDGKYLRDPFAERERRVAQLEKQAGAAEELDLREQTYADRAAEREQARRERLAMQQQGIDIQRLGLELRRGQNGMAKAPSGYQWATGTDGTPTLTYIPGGPADPASKAAKDPTEDQGKSAGYAFRMDSALRQISDLTEKDPSAGKPSLIPTLVGKIPGIGEMAQKTITPAQRQRVENAQLDALDAALTLSTGAAYTKEQLKMISNAYFPQIGESDPTVIEDKRKRLADLVEVARTRAGRAAVPGMSASPAVPPAQAASGLSAAEQAELMKLRQKFGR